MTRVLVGSCALAFAAGWNIANVGPIAEHEAPAYGVGLATVGLFTTTLFVGHLLAQIPGGRAIDAVGAQRIGLASLASIAACNAVLLAAPDAALALAARGAAGLGTGAAFVAAGDYARTTGTPLAQGLFGGASIAGSGLAVGVVPQLHGSLGWRAPYWSALVLAITALPLLAFGTPDRRRRTHTRDLDGNLLGDSRLYRLGSVHAATFGVSVIAGNWIVTLLQRTSSYGDAKAGAVGTLTLVSGLLTRPLGGALLLRRRTRARPLIALSLGAGALGMIALAVHAPLPLGVAIPAALVVGLAAGLPFAAVFTSAQRLRPTAPGAAIGLVNAFAVVAILVGTPLAGLTFSLPGDGRIGFAILAALWALALVALPRERDLA